jgi:hypothetical protein
MRFKLFTVVFLLILILFCNVVHAQAHSATLTWTASTDSGVNYNIYRISGVCPSTATSGFAKITAAPLTATTFTDSTVVPGTYCYYATAVLNGTESLPSNLASAVILPAAPTALSISGTN